MKTDRQLVDEINRRDPDAFETLYRRYRDWVLALAHRFTGNGEQALDVLQETFLYLLKKFPGFQLRCSMKTFLYPAVRHISITIARQSRKTVSDEAAINELPAPDCQRSDQQAELAMVLGQLTGEQRQVVLMRFVDDMSLAEIAQALDIPLCSLHPGIPQKNQKLHFTYMTIRIIYALCQSFKDHCIYYSLTRRLAGYEL